MENLEKTLAISIRGASHFESGKPMQDYSLAVKGEDFSIAVVCDGHGADKHFRSEIGSECAAKATQEKLLEFYRQYDTWAKLCNGLTEKVNRLKVAIITVWQLGIEKYTQENPFTAEELKKASSSFATRQKYDVAQPYGTTILAALVGRDYYLALMIGDGAMAKINGDFSSSILTFPGKHVFDDQPHSATDSLCEQDAYNKMFHLCQPIAEEETVAFALCSDGMSEAFYNDDILLKKFNNYLNYYAEEGLEKATEAIEAQLNQLSKISPMKDDISLAFATNHLETFDKSKQTAPVEEKAQESAPSKDEQGGQSGEKANEHTEKDRVQTEEITNG